MLLLRIFSLLLLVFIDLVQSNCNEEVRNRIIEVRELDTKAHECRSCKKIQIDASFNCPTMGYECDEELSITSNVLDANDGKCAQLRCGNTNSTLAVDGNIVNEVQCMGRQWWVSDDTVAESAVCARKCVACNQFPSEAFENETIIGPLEIYPPSAENSCAVAVCENGAIGVNEGHYYKQSSTFSCTGDGRWKYVGGEPRKHELVACLLNSCDSLPFGENKGVCGQKYYCYHPVFIDGQHESVWKTMECDDNNALRTSDNNEDAKVRCSYGLWTTNKYVPIPASTKVMCVTCPNITMEDSDTVKPTLIGRNKEVKCSDGDLTIEYTVVGGEMKSTKATSLKCSDSYIWDTVGGEFGQFSSLSDAINQGATWKVRCSGPQCGRLPSGGMTQSYCQQNGDPSKPKIYQCSPPEFDQNNNQMVCKPSNPHALRRVSDVEKPFAPSCNLGIWYNEETQIPDTTETICIDCRQNKGWDDFAEAADGKYWCLNTQRIYVQWTKDGVRGAPVEVPSIECNQETFKWEVPLGTALGDYTSLENIEEKGEQWSAVCIIK